MGTKEDYNEGVKDCKDGVGALITASKAYFRGYEDQYEAEQKASGVSENEHV